jgi:ribonuclease HI
LAVKWKASKVGWFKVNTDAAFDVASGTGSVGVVIRDEQGLVIAGGARWFDHVLDALTAEAMAAKEGLELSMEMAVRRYSLKLTAVP